MIIHTIIAILFWTPSFALPNALRAAGDVTFTMVVAIVSMVVFRITLSYVLINVFNKGVISVWFAMALDWVIRTAFFLPRWFSGKWKSKQIT